MVVVMCCGGGGSSWVVVVVVALCSGDVCVVMGVADVASITTTHALHHDMQSAFCERGHGTRGSNQLDVQLGAGARVLSTWNVWHWE